MPGKKRTGMPVGRPRWKPTAQQREQVRSLAGRGVPIRQIAIIIGADPEAMTRECTADIEAGRATAVANVTGVLYQRAIANDHQAFKERQLFLINMAGWTTSHQRHEVKATLEELVQASLKPADGKPGVGG